MIEVLTALSGTTEKFDNLGGDIKVAFFLKNSKLGGAVYIYTLLLPKTKSFCNHLVILFQCFKSLKQRNMI